MQTYPRKDLLIGTDHVVRVADFGAAFVASKSLGDCSARTTPYVSAPEVFLEATNLISSVDSWVVGVVGLALFSGPSMKRSLLTIIIMVLLLLSFLCNNDEKLMIDW